MGRRDTRIPQDEGYVPSPPEGQLIYGRHYPRLHPGGPMDNDAARRRADEQTRAGHEVAVAAGEKRLLARTMDGGRLHSYAADEIGFARTGSGPIATTAPGMLVLGVFFAAVTAFSLFLIAAPVADGQDPLWGALVLTIGGIAGAVYTVRLALAEFRARRIRRERGIPDPSPRQLN